MLVGIMKNEIKLVLRRFYDDKGVKQEQIFSHQWKNIKSKLIKNIKLGRWPKLNTEANKLLKLLQKKISYLSFNNNNKEAMKIVETYSMNILLRYISINSISIQSGSTQGHDNVSLQNEKNKIILLTKTKEIKLKTFSRMKIKLVEIHRSDEKIRNLEINFMIDRILQKQLSLLLDPYYEAKFPEHMYSYRKGRNIFQAVGYLKAVLQRSDTKHSGAILIDIEKCFDNISHESILTHFNLPNK